MQTISQAPTGTTTVLVDGQAHSAHYWAHCQRGVALTADTPEVSVTVVYQRREKTRQLADQAPDRVAASLLTELLDAPRLWDMPRAGYSGHARA